jgi:hypothetical protein
MRNAKSTISLATVVFFTVVLISGCQTYEANRNASNMYKLQTGQTKEQVLAIMGKPSKTETHTIQGKPVEFWLYQTEASHHKRHGSKQSDYTPLVLQDGVLQGWGRNHYDEVDRTQQDIKIERQ